MKRGAGPLLPCLHEHRHVLPSRACSYHLVVPRRPDVQPPVPPVHPQVVDAPNGALLPREAPLLPPEAQVVVEAADEGRPCHGDALADVRSRDGIVKNHGAGAAELPDRARQPRLLRHGEVHHQAFQEPDAGNPWVEPRRAQVTSPAGLAVLCLASLCEICAHHLARRDREGEGGLHGGVLQDGLLHPEVLAVVHLEDPELWHVQLRPVGARVHAGAQQHQLPSRGAGVGVVGPLENAIAVTCSWDEYPASHGCLHPLPARQELTHRVCEEPVSPRALQTARCGTHPCGEDVIVLHAMPHQPIVHSLRQTVPCTWIHK
mmetsp:Transcript_90795/g.236524  ORF Transcript_90795/g.236524 Transcript_90795/m.236524 type:complete len:318 (-) Transcript_90795:92-1045(-)